MECMCACAHASHIYTRARRIFMHGMHAVCVFARVVYVESSLNAHTHTHTFIRQIVLEYIYTYIQLAAAKRG
jgi:hypothetical protein